VQRDLEREVEHRALPWREVGLAVIDRHLVGDCGFRARTRRIAPCATTQYWHWLAPLVATTIISRSALLRPLSFSINAS
jgi:hypothetical protein